MATMRKVIWLAVAAIEAIASFILAKPAVLNALKIAHTRDEVIDLDFAYFVGMLTGDAIRFAIAALLIGHAVWLVRKLV